MPASAMPDSADHPRRLVNRFFAWMEDGFDRDAYAAVGRFVVFMGLSLGFALIFCLAIVWIVSFFVTEPACDPGSHRWHRTQGKTTTSKCIPDSEASHAG